MILTSARKFDTLGKQGVKALCDRSPRLTTSSDRVSQTISVRTQGSTRHKQLGSKGGRSLGKDGLPSLGACPEGNLFELVQRDRGIFVIDHVLVRFIESSDEQRVLRMPSPGDRVILLFHAGAHDCESHRNEVTGLGSVANGPNSVGMALEVTQFCHRKIDENAINT